MTDDERGATRFDPAPPEAGGGRKGTTKTPKADVSPDMIWLGAVGAWIPQRWCTDRPLVSQLVGEDLGWRLATADCRSRRPSIWRPGERGSWRRELERAAQKRARLVEAARDLGISASPVPPQLGVFKRFMRRVVC